MTKGYRPTGGSGTNLKQQHSIRATETTNRKWGCEHHANNGLGEKVLAWGSDTRATTEADMVDGRAVLDPWLSKQSWPEQISPTSEVLDHTSVELLTRTLREVVFAHT